MTVQNAQAAPSGVIIVFHARGRGQHAAFTGEGNGQRGTLVRVLVGCLLMLLAALIGTHPFISMLVNGNTAQQADLEHDEAARRLTEAERHRQWNRAVAYNKALYRSGQPVLGKIVDPFTAAPGEQRKLTRDYESQITLPADGVMSIIRYPRLGINLPVRHGTSADVLSKGAGHLYGTSLPVGGRNTHTVISAHSGLTDKIMFDRLDGLGGRARKGDVFYLTTLGTSLAYRVYSIKVIDPGDFSALRIQPGKDIATLLTCTPYGVNTQRLLVTGARANIPKQAPPPSRNPQDLTWLWWLLGIIAVWLVMMAASLTAYRRAGGRNPFTHRSIRHISRRHARRSRV